MKFNMDEELEKVFNDSMAQTWTQQAECKANLTVEKLLETCNRVKRDNGQIIVISTKAIPDDCYGVLMLRPEDAALWKPKK